MASRLLMLGDADVAALIDPRTALELARRTLKDQAAGGSWLSTPSAMILETPIADRPSARFKAASVGYLGASGIRLLSHPSAGRRTSNYTAVFRHEDALLSGLVADGWLSCARTAAFGIVAIEALARRGPLQVTLFGTGAIANEIVPMLAHALDVATLRVSSRRQQSMDAFVAAQTSKCAFPVRSEADAERAVRNADVVITITESATPLVGPGMLGAGAVVCSMGSCNEVDFGVMHEADRLIVDDPAYASEMGDGRAWIAQGHLSPPEFLARIDALACDVIAGKKPGRRNEAERIVVLMQGMAIGDIAFAAYALESAARAGRGTWVDLP